jgi:hypothetical protein
MCDQALSVRLAYICVPCLIDLYDKSFGPEPGDIHDGKNLSISRHLVFGGDLLTDWGQDIFATRFSFVFVHTEIIAKAYRVCTWSLWRSIPNVEEPF